MVRSCYRSDTRPVCRVAVVHGTQRSGALPSGLASAIQVVRGWLALTEQASRFVLPDGEQGASLAEAITAERCELALGAVPRADDDPEGFALALGELVRMGEHPDHWIPELVGAVERIGPRPGWDADAALGAAGRVLAAAGEQRARRDLQRIVAGRAGSERPTRAPAGVRSVAWLESQLATDGCLLSNGFPTAWLGQSIDVYGVPTGDASSVSFAIRWHGERPAVLWEQTGPPVQLTAPLLAPAWSTTEAKGEALWPPMTGGARHIPSSDAPVIPLDDAPISFN